MRLIPAPRRIANLTNVYTIVLVLLLFAILPLSQQLLVRPPPDLVIVRRVNVIPPPPPPPQVQSNTNSGAISQAGINIDSILPAVDLNPIATGASLDRSDVLELGMTAMDFDLKPQANFKMEGIGFGTAGLDRQPIMIVRPVLNSDYMRSRNIEHFDVVVLVKWLADGSLTFIGIEEIEYPDAQFGAMVRDAISRIRYSRPTIDGEPVERFLRLPLTINSD